MNLKQIEALVDDSEMLVHDRGLLMASINEVVAIAQSDHGITRASLLKIQEVIFKVLNGLKYGTIVKDPVRVDE